MQAPLAILSQGPFSHAAVIGIYPPALTRVLLAQSKQPHSVCILVQKVQVPFQGGLGVRAKTGSSAGVSVLSHDLPWAALLGRTPSSPSGLHSLAFLFPLSSFSQWLDLYCRSPLPSSMSNGSHPKSLQLPFCSGSLRGLRK